MSFKETVSWYFSYYFFFWKRHQYVCIDPVKKNPHFAEQPLLHHKCGQKSCEKMSTFCWKAGWAHNCVKKNPVTKRPHFAEQAAGHHKWPKITWQNFHILLKSRLRHHKRVEKILWQNVHISLNSQQNITNGSKNHVKNCPNFALKRVDMMSQSILRRVDIMSHVANHPPWSRGERQIHGRIV